VNNGKYREWLVTSFAAAASLFVLVPIAFIVFGSFKTPAEVTKLELSLPSLWQWENYSIVFEEGKMLSGLLNSAFVTSSTVLLVLLAGSMASFIIARSRARWVAGIYLLFVAGLIAPPSLIPTIKIMQVLGLANEYVGIILYYAANYFPFVIFLMTGFVRAIPRALDEAAFVDGAKGQRLFFRVIFPLMTPILATAAIFVFMLVWNDFQGPLYLLNDSSKWTIPLSVFNFVSRYGTQWQYVFSDLIIAMLPVLLVYLAAQRFIIEGMTAGSVKG